MDNHRRQELGKGSNVVPLHTAAVCVRVGLAQRWRSTHRVLVPCLAAPQETAINIAVSCALVKNPDDVMVLNVDDKSESEQGVHCMLVPGRLAC